MYAFGSKPVIVLGTTAMIAFGANGIAAQARGLPGTTPATTAAAGGGGIDTAALAKSLGVSESDLAAAMAEVRTSLGSTSRSSDFADEAEAIADALDVSTATVTSVLTAQVRRAAAPTGAATATTPQATAAPSKPAGARGAGRDQTALIAALVQATGKTEREVRAALKAGRDAHAKAEAERQEQFAELLAAKLGISTSKVAAALEVTTPVRPSHARGALVGATS